MRFRYRSRLFAVNDIHRSMKKYASQLAAARAHEHPSYNPDRLLDALKDRLRLRTDVALARRLETTPVVISKIRHRKLPVVSWLLVSMHEESGVSIRDLRYLGGDFRLHTGPSAPLLPPD